MATKPKCPPDTLLKAAATLRAAGSSWAIVGREMNRRPETVKRWPLFAPKKWRKYFEQASRELARDVTAESVCALRTDLRGKDDKARRDSATKLLRFGLTVLNKPGRKKATANDAATAKIVDYIRYIEGLSPTQLQVLINDLGYERKAE
jgi:hypothetical protein